MQTMCLSTDMISRSGKVLLGWLKLLLALLIMNLLVYTYKDIQSCGITILVSFQYIIIKVFLDFESYMNDPIDLEIDALDKIKDNSKPKKE